MHSTSPSEAAPDVLTARVEVLLQRHQRLLAIELAAVVDEFRRLCPSFCDDPIFSEAWESFAASPPGVLAEALAEPAMEAWVGRARALIASPAMRSCPAHHVPRTLARFSALMINSAGWKGSLLQGTALVLGGESIPALRGAAQVLPPTARRRVVRWRWSDRLTLHDESGHRVVELATAEEPSPGAEGMWSVEKARQVAGIHVCSQPRCMHQGEEARAEVSIAFGKACEALSPTVRGILARATRAAAPGCPLHPLEAMSFHTIPDSPTPAAAARELALGLVGRCARVHHFDTGSRLEEAVGIETKEELVVMVAHELLRDGGDEPRSVLDRVLAVCERSEPVRRSALPERERGGLLDLRPAVARAGLTSTEDDRWCEVKSRDPRVAPSWRLNDAMLGLESGDLERLRAVLVTWPDQEVRGFGLACVDYHRGHFTRVVGHLLDCLKADNVCEDYWLLLAFCLRHLRRLDLFEEVVFGGSRAESILDRASECV